jgi:flagellar basal-body rod modification protein FlgD
MEIASTTNTAGTSVAKTGDANAAISSDFETFLRMLTTQMQNQDPLNPIESADFAVQLATFSGVEQQVKTNDLLQSLAQQMGILGMSQLAGWVGMEARVAAPVYFDGSPVTLAPEFPAGADLGTLVVRNEAGNEVQRISMTRADGTVDWAGVDESGVPLAAGVYSFELATVVNGQNQPAGTVEAFAEITEARLRDGETVIVLDGGIEVTTSQITALRAPRD